MNKKINPDFLRILGILKNKNLTGPETIYLNITNKCNFNCLYCRCHSDFIPGNKIEKNIDLSLEKFKELISDFSKLNVKKIMISGDGEPFLHPKIDDILKTIKENGMGININTNCTFGSEKLKLLAFVDVLNINFSAASNKTYEKIQDIRRRGLFYKVLKNIITINNLKHTHRLNTILEVSYIINKFNFREVSEFLLLSRKIGIDRVNFRIMNRNAYSKSIVLSANDIKEFRKILKSESKISTNSNIKDIYEIFKNTSFLKSAQDRKKYDGNVYNVHHCYMGWLFAFIDMKGDVFPCCSSNDNDKVGNIYENRFYEMWNSPRFHKIRLKYLHAIDIRDRCGESCRLCWFAGVNEKISGKLEKLRSLETQKKVI